MATRRLMDGEFRAKYLKPKYVFPFLILLLVLFFFVIPQWKSIRNIFFITLFFVLGCVSYFYRRFFNVRIGIEFVSVGTFLCTLSYGIGVGFFIGNATALISELIGSRIDERIFVNLLSTNAIVIATPFVAGMAQSNLIIAALIINLLYNLIGVGGNMLLGGNPGKTIVFVATSVFWYLAFFLKIGPIVYSFMIG
ncbi:MAG: hypothetical protein EPN86_06335 [Nanoarchaeota archaeon]|nr:MAG: hypothetical protein EPN86_06335 [Nanoarchaeota archaeon]